MGKKNKDQEPNVNLGSVTNRDIIQRINFLYQASTYLSSISSAGELAVSVPASRGERSCDDKNEKNKKRRKARHPASAAELSRSYVKSMRIIGQKATVKMDPTLKRTLCKGCNVVLIPGSTATVRVKGSSSHGHTMVYMCTACNTARRIPAPPVLKMDAPPQNFASIPTLAQNVGMSAQPGEDAMDVAIVPGNAQSIVQSGEHETSKAARKRKKRPVPRLPPLFERKVGHVLFRGTARGCIAQPIPS